MKFGAVSSAALALVVLAACGGELSETDTLPPKPNPVSPSAVVIATVPSESRGNDGETPKPVEPRSQVVLQLPRGR